MNHAQSRQIIRLDRSERRAYAHHAKAMAKGDGRRALRAAALIQAIHRRFSSGMAISPA